MTDPSTGQRSFLQALRVPFDLAGVALGAAAVVTAKVALKAAGWQPGGILSGGRGELVPPPFEPFAETAVGIAVLFLVVMIFGVALCRIAGMRIARDEGVPAGEALGFAVRSLPESLGAVAFSGGVALAVYYLVAGGGWVAAQEGWGPFAGIVILPLAFLGTLILLLLLWGSLLGFPLVLPAVAVERNGALDAASRAFSYASSRPALYFVYAFTVGAFAWLLWRATGLAEQLVLDTTAAFVEPSSAAARAFRSGASAAFALRLPEGAAAGSAAVAHWWGWALALVFHLSFTGWWVYYFFGGATAAYVALRRDVDGTEDEEIWIESEQGEEFGAPEEPEPASAPPPAVPPPPPASPPGPGA
jgi:hypothetical protein